MTNPTATISVSIRRVGLCLLAAMLLMEVGCVRRSVYERVIAEAQEHTRALEAVREDVRGLDEQIIQLQAANRREDTTTAELRTAIQREEEQLPVMRQRAENMLVSLKTQVATLMNQSWHLARKIADIRHESASLQHRAAQYTQEMKTVRTPVLEEADGDKPTIIAESPEPSPSPLQEATPPHQTEPTPATPTLTSAAPSVPSPSVNVEPAATSDSSWIGMIVGWFATFWNWLFS